MEYVRGRGLKYDVVGVGGVLPATLAYRTDPIERTALTTPLSKPASGCHLKQPGADREC